MSPAVFVAFFIVGVLCGFVAAIFALLNFLSVSRIEPILNAICDKINAIDKTLAAVVSQNDNALKQLESHHGKLNTIITRQMIIADSTGAKTDIRSFENGKS